MEIASFLDHTLLRPNVTSIEIEKLCLEAKQHHMRAVCIPPYHVPKARTVLEGSSTAIATVIGFPMGYSSVAAKIKEINRAAERGANEFDAVINICALKNGDLNYLHNEISSITTAVHLRGGVVKIILETGLLNKREIEAVCTLCKQEQVDFVKNATGFHAEGASTNTIAFLKSILEDEVQIKASGGIRTSTFARELIEAGANRLGSSTCLALL